MNKAMVHIQGDRAVASSVDIALTFERSHKNVLQSIENILPHISEPFSRLNFQPSNYESDRGKAYPCYLLTKNGFAMVALGFTGKKAIKFREAYVTRFDEMEGILRRRQYKHRLLNETQMTDAVRAALGQARAEMSLTMAINAMILRGLHIPPITREAMVKLVKTGVIEGFKHDRQWHVYQDSFADWLEQRKLSS